MPQHQKPTPREVLAATTKRTTDLIRKAGKRLTSRTAINSRPAQPEGKGTVTLLGRSINLREIDPISYGLATAILLALVLVFFVNGREAQGDDNQTTTTAKRGVVELTSTGSGSIESARNTDLNFETSGKVVQVYVSEGDRVKKGDAIARLDRRSAELAVEEAEADLEDAENGTSTTSTTGVAYTGEGVETTNAVYTGAGTATVLVMSDDGDPQYATETGTTDESDETGETGPTGPTGETGATGPAGPTENLPDDGGTPNEQPDAGAEMPSTSGEMSGGSMGGSMGGSAGGGSTSTESSETAVARAELELEEAKQALEATVLRAPYTGTIVSLEGAVGDTVTGEATTTSSSSGSSDTGSSETPAAGADTSTGSGSSSAFAVLQQLDALEMEVSVSEADINQIHLGQRATVTISSADDEQLAAKVSNVGLLATTDSSGVVTYPVTVRINQKSGLVKPGMSATVSIVIDQASGVITVPNQALTGNSIEVVDGDTTETLTVETGLVGDSTTEILSGLEDGQEIAIPQVEISDSGMPAGEMGEGMPGGFPGGGGGGGGFPGGGGSMPSPPSGGGFPGG